MLDAPRYSGPVSDHFDGIQFHNQQRSAARGLRDVLKWTLDRRREVGTWRKWVDAEPGPAPPERVGGDRLRVTFVNHATTLIQVDGLNILTDPVWSDRVSPFSFIGPKRHRPAGIRFEDLPPIDIVLVSHNHYDHMDRATLRRLATEHHPRIVTSLGNRAVLESLGVPGALEMDWWDHIDLPGGQRITSVPAEHFSGRGTRDRNATSWCGFVIEAASGNIYFAADTGFGPQFEQVRKAFGDLRLALLPIGAYKPRWFMSPVHMGPDEALRAHEILGAETSIGIHFGTFAMADDGEHEPAQEIARMLDEYGEGRPRFVTLENGEGMDVEKVGD